MRQCANYVPTSDSTPYTIFVVFTEMNMHVTVVGYDAVQFGRYVLLLRRNLLLYYSIEEVVMTETLVRGN
jgi:hypothetical protein